MCERGQKAAFLCSQGLKGKGRWRRQRTYSCCWHTGPEGRSHSASALSAYSARSAAAPGWPRSSDPDLSSDCLVNPCKPQICSPPECQLLLSSGCSAWGPHFWCDSYGSALSGPGSLASSLPGQVCLRWQVSHKLLAVHRSYWRKAQDSWAAAGFPSLLVRMWGNCHQARRSGDCNSEKKKENNSARSSEHHT